MFAFHLHVWGSLRLPRARGVLLAKGMKRGSEAADATHLLYRRFYPPIGSFVARKSRKFAACNSTRLLQAPVRYAARVSSSVPEVPDSRKHHGKTQLVRHRNHVLVFHAAARLNHRRCP